MARTPKTRAIVPGPPKPVEPEDNRPSVMPHPINMSVHSMTMDAILPRDTEEERVVIDRICKRTPNQYPWLGQFILPPFQRPPVWTEAQNIKFIESIWLGYDIGRYVIYRPHGDYEPMSDALIDGQQRIRAIIQYAAGDFPVFGHRYPDLPRRDRRSFQSGHIFARSEIRAKMTMDELREIYNRLNYGGTSHTEEQRA